MSLDSSVPAVDCLLMSTRSTLSCSEFHYDPLQWILCFVSSIPKFDGLTQNGFMDH
jgi:hypothetical protein